MCFKGGKEIVRQTSIGVSLRLLGTSRVIVPRDKVKLSFSRSSGPGGQNVNKVSTRATLRFNCLEASWLSDDVKSRLVTSNKSRVNKEGVFSVSSDSHRTQKRNIEECFEKLQCLVDEACIEPKIRKQRKGIGKHTKQKRKEHKRHRQKIKQSRGDSS